MTTELTKDDVREVVRTTIDTALNEHLLDMATHRAHHLAVARWIERQEARRQRWERIEEKLVGTGILSLFGAAVGALGYAAIQWIKSVRGGS